MEKKAKTFSWRELEDGFEGCLEMQQALSYISLIVRAKKRRERAREKMCCVSHSAGFVLHRNGSHSSTNTLLDAPHLRLCLSLSIILEQARLVHS